MHTGTAGSSRAYHNNVPHPAERRASTSKRRLVSLSARMQSWCISGHGALNADRVFPTTPRERSPTPPSAVSSTRTPSLRSKSQLDSSRIPSRSSLHPGLNPNTRTPTSVGSLHTNRFGLPPRRLLLTTVHARSTFSSVFRSDVDITLFLSTAPVSSSSRVTPARRPILAERRTQSIAEVAVAEIETRSKARGG